MTEVVYLLHLDTPYKHARHYTGSTGNLTARLADHAAGRGARLLAVVQAAGIGWQVARTWPGGRDAERAIKRRHNAPRLCPLCSVRPQPCPALRPAAPEPFHWHWSGAELAGQPPEVDMSAWPEPPF
jgi:predicted GIY-YIG superfamily endonuclease